MRGAENVGTGFSRLRREVHSGVVNTDSTPDVHSITPLDDFFSKHFSVISLPDCSANCSRTIIQLMFMNSVRQGGIKDHLANSSPKCS